MSDTDTDTSTLLPSSGPPPPPPAAAFALCCCCVLPFLAGCVAYVTYGIIFLVRDKSICGDYSQIWIFCLAMLVFPFVMPFLWRLVEARSPNNPSNAGVNLMVFLVTVTLLLVYGYLVIFDANYFGVVCDAMKTEGLYVWAKVAFWFFFCIASIFCLSICIISCKLMLFPDGSKNKETELLFVSDLNRPTDSPEAAADAAAASAAATAAGIKFSAIDSELQPVQSTLQSVETADETTGNATAGSEKFSPPMAFALCCCVVLPFLAAFFAYFIYGIIFLVKDKSLCGGFSQIWIFCLGMLILPCFNSFISNVISKQHPNNPFLNLVFINFTQLVLIIFGYLVLFESNYSGYVCDAMKKEGLYIWAQVAFWYTVTLSAATALGALVTYFFFPSTFKSTFSSNTHGDGERELLLSGGLGGGSLHYETAEVKTSDVDLELQPVPPVLVAAADAEMIQ